MRGKRGLADDMLKSEHLDQWHTARQLSERLNVSITSVNSALCTLHTSGHVVKEAIPNMNVCQWKRAEVHWIHKTPISSNPPKLFGERCWI